MNVLAIDTASEVLSLTLHIDGTPSAAENRPARPTPPPRVYTETRDIGLKHTQVLMPLVDRLMREAEFSPDRLDLVACTRGPGSFTGLRIGIATAKGLALAVASKRELGRPPMVSVPTLEVMAAALPADESIVVPVIDGRKNRFYCALFSGGKRLTGDLDLDAEVLATEIEKVRNTGVRSGGDRLADSAERAARVIVTGPHATLFLSRLAGGSSYLSDPSHRRGHSETLVKIAIARYLETGPDDAGQGPVYVRGSDAELSKSIK